MTIAWAGGVLVWLDDDGKPVRLIGACRELDVPGAHTPPAAAVKHSRSTEDQLADMWPASYFDLKKPAG